MQHQHFRVGPSNLLMLTYQLPPKKNSKSSDLLTKSSHFSQIAGKASEFISKSSSSKIVSVEAANFNRSRRAEAARLSSNSIFSRYIRARTENSNLIFCINFEQSTYPLSAANKIELINIKNTLIGR